MAKVLVTVRCWNHGHETKELLTLRQAEKLQANILDHKVVCPVCKSELAIIECPGHLDNQKLIQCSSGHLTLVSAFANNMLHFSFGNDSESFVNVEGTPEEFDNMLDSKEVICYHRVGEGTCDCQLKALDDKPVEKPRATGIKTKVRVGDLWDKNHVEPVRNGSYDTDGNYNESKTDAANRRRLQNMRRKRLIDEEKHPGRRINKPTNQIHERRSKGDIDMS